MTQTDTSGLGLQNSQNFSFKDQWETWFEQDPAKIESVFSFRAGQLHENEGQLISMIRLQQAGFGERL